MPRQESARGSPAGRVDVPQGLTFGQEPRHPDSRVLDPCQRGEELFLARGPRGQLFRAPIEHQDAPLVVRAHPGDEVAQPFERALAPVGSQVTEVHVHQEVARNERFVPPPVGGQDLIRRSRREVGGVDRPLVHPSEVVDRHGLAVHLDREVLALQIRHRPSALVGDGDVEVHDAHLDLFGEGRRLLGGEKARRERQKERRENPGNPSSFHRFHPRLWERFRAAADS